MTQKTAISVKHLAKPTVEAIQTIVKRVEKKCPECNGRGWYLAKDPVDCSECNGTGKVKGEWKWEPEVFELFIYRREIFVIDDVERDVITPKDWVIRYYDKKMVVKDRLINSSKVIPILHWEKIEEILEGMGHKLKLNETINTKTFQKGWHVTICDESKPLADGLGKDRQTSAMLAVIELSKRR